MRRAADSNSQRNVSARLVKLALFAFRPVVESGYVDHYLAFGIEFDVGAIHWPGRWAFKVDSLAVIATAMARTFKLVLACLPVGSTTRDGCNARRSQRVDRKSWSPRFDIAAATLYRRRVHSHPEHRYEKCWKARGSIAAGRTAETLKNMRSETRDNCGPNDSPPHFVNRRIGRALNQRAYRLSDRTRRRRRHRCFRRRRFRSGRRSGRSLNFRRRIR